MEILISDIPMEGLHRSGEFPASIFELSREDSIRPMGSVSYDVTIYAMEGLVAFTGCISGPFQLQCCTCLEYVDFRADFPEWSSDLDLEEGQRSFDLQSLIREDFLLNLPSYARCDELTADRECPKAAEIASIQETSDSPAPGGNDVWDALDGLS